MLNMRSMVNNIAYELIILTKVFYFITFRLKNPTSLRKHINRHNSTKVKCTFCDKIAPNKSALGQHIKNVHSEATHKCGFCEKAFKKAINLKVFLGTKYLRFPW